MKIAMITFEYPPFIMGGAGVYADNISKELTNLGHDVTIITPQIELSPPYEINGKLAIYRIPLLKYLPFKALQFWIKLPAYFKQLNDVQHFDVVHFNALSYWFLRKKLSNAPHIGTVHHLVKDAYNKNRYENAFSLLDLSGENNFALRVIEKRYIQSIDRFIAVSNFTKDRIVKSYNIDPGKIDIIYNGVNVPKCNFSQSEVLEYKKELSLPDKPIILFVGRIDDPRKGLPLLFNAFRQVLLSRDAALLIVGKGNRSKLNTMACELGILSDVHFAGYVDDVHLRMIYQLCDVYVIPSRLEGFGLTILEAMSAGKPIVATNVGAIPELIKNMENGILVESNDAQGLANTILQFISNTSYSNAVGETNKKVLDNRFTWIDNAKQVINLFNNCSYTGKFNMYK